MGGQLDIRPPQSKNWGGRVPPIPPRIDAPGSNTGSIRDDPYWISTENILELIDTCINKISLI